LTPALVGRLCSQRSLEVQPGRIALGTPPTVLGRYTFGRRALGTPYLEPRSSTGDCLLKSLRFRGCGSRGFEKEELRAARGGRPTQQMAHEVRCERHGLQDETFVCQHVVSSLHDRAPRGFHWSQGSDQHRPDAWCSECNERLRQGGWEWTRETEQAAGVRLLCGACYDEAKALNGF
jgi:hypothetical protein